MAAGRARLGTRASWARGCQAGGRGKPAWAGATTGGNGEGRPGHRGGGSGGHAKALTLVFAQLFHVLNMRDRGSGLLRNAITRNRWVWGALALCAAMLVAVVHIPPLARILHVTPLDATGWAMVLIAGLIPSIIGQIVKLLPARAG